MGLDLAIVLARKGKKPIWDDYTQLAYGRKAWELCYELGGGSEPSEWFKLDTETWDRVIEKIAPIADKLPEISDKIVFSGYLSIQKVGNAGKYKYEKSYPV